MTDRFTGRRVLIVGDLMTDVDIHGTCTRFAAEAAGCPVIREDRRESRPGGAGAVAEMVLGLGAIPDLATGPETSIRTRFLVGGRQLWRHDIDAQPPAPDESARLCATVEAAVRRVEVVLISDYGRGVCSPAVVQTAIRGGLARHLPVIVDPPRGQDWSPYRGATLIKCNRPEWEADGRIGVAGGVIVTDGPRGMTHFRRGLEAAHYPAEPAPVVDVTGAGDMVLACLGVCAAAGVDWPAACKFANAMAALKVQRRGAVPVGHPR
jgi:D-beta-D-heptose 7-phosphate kinase/D-beta-D-heptose 1-phosphate adenosyltransferase